MTGKTLNTDTAVAADAERDTEMTEKITREDGTLWARELHEFHDAARFEPPHLSPGAAQMSDELVNTLENLGLFFGGATGRLTRDYGELSGDNFQMMAMHEDPKKLAKDLASLAEAAARIRLLEQQLKTTRKDALEEALKILAEARDNSTDMRCCGSGTQTMYSPPECCGDPNVYICWNDVDAAIRSLGDN